MPAIRDAADADLPRILSIYNDAIEQTTAVWSLTPDTLDARRVWLAERQRRGWPVLVAEAADGAVAGFASYAQFRPWEGYARTVEHSLYVDAAARRQGVGGALLAALIERGRQQRMHMMIGGISADNDASLRLHEAFGFRETGRLPQVGQKFGRWLDLVFVQLALEAEGAA